jgi:hypothetical protein
MVFPAKARESVGRQRPKKMEGENSLMRGNIDEYVQTPRKHREYWPPGDEPRDAECYRKYDEAVACIVERPHKTEMLWATRSGQKG